MKAIASLVGALQLRPPLHRRRQRREDHVRPAAARQGRLERRGPARRHRALEREGELAMASADAGGKPVASDALVFFGATGDLAYKKIFPSLQGMVQRGHLSVPGHRRREVRLDRRAAARARAREPQGVRRRRRRGRVREARRRCSSTSTATTPTRPRSPKLRKALGAAKHPTHYLAIPPSLFGSVIERSAKSGCADGARVVIEKPFGHNFATAHALNADPPLGLPRVVGLPHRPLPRQGGRREPPVLPLRQHVPRADLEPQLRGLRADHDGRGVRHPGPRASSTTRPARSAT